MEIANFRLAEDRFKIGDFEFQICIFENSKELLNFEVFETHENLRVLSGLFRHLVENAGPLTMKVSLAKSHWPSPTDQQ